MSDEENNRDLGFGNNYKEETKVDISTFKIYVHISVDFQDSLCDNLHSFRNLDIKSTHDAKHET